MGSSKPTPELWPVFICYRRTDGSEVARRLHEALDQWAVKAPSGKQIQLDVYLDEAVPGVGSWKEVHRPYLEKARAILVVCTPGTKLNEGEGDWVHREIDWWLEHRSVAPILVDPLKQGIRYVPEQIVERWPDIQRIELVPGEWAGLTPEELAENAPALRRKILGAILPSSAAVYAEELESERRRARRLRVALACSVALLGLAIGLAYYAYGQRDAALENQRIASEQRDMAVQNADLALARQLSSEAFAAALRPSQLSGYYDRALLLAVEAVRMSPTPETLGNLLRVLATNPEGAPFPRGLLVAHEGQGVFQGQRNQANAVTFSPDGTLLASGGADGVVRIWDVLSGRGWRWQGAPLEHRGASFLVQR